MNTARTNKNGTIRCAIYTRKSTDEGLEQEFNSLDAQRESAEAFIRSHQHEGWLCLPDRYDDGGFTGGNMERPALKRLLADIEAGEIDCVVVYKVDRLSRSLLTRPVPWHTGHSTCLRSPLSSRSSITPSPWQSGQVTIFAPSFIISSPIY